MKKQKPLKVKRLKSRKTFNGKKNIIEIKLTLIGEDFKHSYIMPFKMIETVAGVPKNLSVENIIHEGQDSLKVSLKSQLSRFTTIFPTSRFRIQGNLTDEQNKDLDLLLKNKLLLSNLRKPNFDDYRYALALVNIWGIVTPGTMSDQVIKKHQNDFMKKNFMYKGHDFTAHDCKNARFAPGYNEYEKCLRELLNRIIPTTL